MPVTLGIKSSKEKLCGQSEGSKIMEQLLRRKR